MSDFDANFPDDALMTILGDDVTYTPAGGDPVQIKAIVNYGITQTFAVDSYVPQGQFTVEALKADVPAIAKGDTFTHKSKTLTVDAVGDDDGIFILLVVR